MPRRYWVIKKTGETRTNCRERVGSLARAGVRGIRNSNRLATFDLEGIGIDLRRRLPQTSLTGISKKTGFSRSLVCSKLCGLVSLVQCEVEFQKRHIPADSPLPPFAYFFQVQRRLARLLGRPSQIRWKDNVWAFRKNAKAPVRLSSSLKPKALRAGFSDLLLFATNSLNTICDQWNDEIFVVNEGEVQGEILTDDRSMKFPSAREIYDGHWKTEWY